LIFDDSRRGHFSNIQENIRMTNNAGSVTSFDAALRTSPSGSQRMGFVILWFVWAALLGGSLLIGNLAGRHSSAATVSMRMGASLALMVTAWLAVFLWHSSVVCRFALCIAVGMTLGTIGDFFNADLLRFIPLPDPVLGGIAAFGLGHIAYILGCLILSRQAGLTDRRTFVIAVTIWQLIGLVTWYFVVLSGTNSRGLVWPSLPYSVLLSGTAGITSGLALNDLRFLPLALGGALFLASDLILAFGMFSGQFPHQTEWVWLTYGPGQMLIVFSVLSAKITLDRRITT
jgi:hypothetical protein